MKTKLIALAFIFPLTSLASTVVPIENSPIVLEDKLTEETLILEKNGISVFASIFKNEGNTYSTLLFKNTTNEQIRFLWSAKVAGNPITVNQDGTTEAYITLDSGSSVTFGKFNSNDPLIELKSKELEKDIFVNIEIQ